ncbi:hypothetical protein MKW94_011658 [Papaver nudicaule]|uniref:Bifunctional inhibitor/plant lipid transfer protein/seed storage helical domain-containing protein n=1 Tax=Papaver nudicaule TaxID=74823 RepID=A0AA41SCF2_PAPNU|nr:hypothetical protein [Papaver nudicaule]
MARFTILAALFLVMLSVVNASTENQTGQQSRRCQREMQGMRMNMCQQYLQQSAHGRGMETANPTGQMRRQCCREMGEVSENCRCQAIDMMMQDMMQRGEYQGQEMREMMQTARQLPSMCNMRPQYCEIHETGRSSGRCQGEMQRMHMNMCQQYLQQSTQGLVMVTTNPTGQMKRQCCREMGEVSENCRCEAVNMMIHDMMQRGEYQGQEMREMMQTARQLPSMCNMRPQYCEIRGTGY